MITSSPSSKFPPPIKVTTVAKLLSISRQSVKALIDNGDLSGVKLGPTRRKAKRVHLRVTYDSLARFYQKRFGRELELHPQKSL